jgi:UDP-glucose:O-linked fucose beta-1,3-glucosyltransferase
LAEWLRVEAEKEEDNAVLLKYSKEDEAKIKDLDHSITKLEREVNRRKAVLSAEVTETQVAQVELDKTTEAFKQLHQERQELITQWEEAIQTMKKHDLDIVQAQEDYQSQKLIVAQTRSKIKEREEIYEAQNAMNADIEKDITARERQLAKFREDLSTSVQGLQRFKNEIDVLKNTLNKSATEFLNKKAELNNAKNDLKERQLNLESNVNNFNELKKKMHTIDSETMSLEQKAEQLQEMVKKDELKDKELVRKMKSIREIQFKKTQILFNMKKEEKNLETEIQGGEASIKNLSTKIQRLDQDALKQRAMIYAMEFNIQQLERKVRRAEGDRTDEEKEGLSLKIKELTEGLEAVNSKFILLNTQLKKSQEDLRHCKRRLDTLQKDKHNILTVIEELNIYNESASHQLKAKIKQREELMVEENILRLEIRKMRGFLNARADEVRSL